MIYAIDDIERPLTHIPHEQEYRRWRSRLSDDEYDAIETEIVERIGSREVVTSSWVPGNKWEGTPFEPIVSKACEHDVAASGLCFGLFFWVCMQKHPAKWLFERYQLDGIGKRGLTYFQIRQ